MYREKEEMRMKEEEQEAKRTLLDREKKQLAR